MSLSYDAMVFAREVHKDQRRKYTGDHYVIHLGEVAGIAATVFDAPYGIRPEVVTAVCWLHDCMEDQGVTIETLTDRFGACVAVAVNQLSDLEEGNRAERKAASRARLAQAWPWVQTIKVADLISNTPSIVLHDPKFAVTYLEEKRLLLDVLTQADDRLLCVARELLATGREQVDNVSHKWLTGEKTK